MNNDTPQQQPDTGDGGELELAIYSLPKTVVPNDDEVYNRVIKVDIDELTSFISRRCAAELEALLDPSVEYVEKYTIESRIKDLKNE